MGKLDGKVAIITGGATGVGKGIARTFVNEGATVVIASRNKDALEKTAAELSSNGGTVDVMPTDVTDEAQVISLFTGTLSRHGRVDIAVNNSGVEASAPLDEMTLESFQSVVAVNLTGVFLCCREAMKIMKPQGGGKIINIGSTAAYVPRPNTASYGATKSGVIGLTHVAALEGREHNIAVSCLNPGNVAVEKRAHDRFHTEPMMSVDDVGAAALAMAALPDGVNFYSAMVLPLGMPFLGRG
jgi:NAD(P)-dependent dehydrogenase (short-subunit alcohol dehydrogenase family)